MKYLPLALATLVIVAVQIGCTYALHARSIDETFVDHIEQLAYDGDVIRVELGRAWPSESSAETRVVGRVVLTKSATLTLHRQLAELIGAFYTGLPQSPAEQPTNAL